MYLQELYLHVYIYILYFIGYIYITFVKTHPTYFEINTCHKTQKYSVLIVYIFGPLKLIALYLLLKRPELNYTQKFRLSPFFELKPQTF